MVMRKSASTSSEVIGQMTTEACLSGIAFDSGYEPHPSCGALNRIGEDLWAFLVGPICPSWPSTCCTAMKVAQEVTRKMPGPAGFSLLAGKKQGISSVPASVIPIWHRKNLLDQSLTAKFPTHRSRELMGLLQGIWSAHQGSLRSDQGKPIHRAAHR